MGVPRDLKMIRSSSASLAPGKRGLPVTISAKMQPADHMSMGVEYLREPSKTSGALYHKVTTSCE